MDDKSERKLTTTWIFFRFLWLLITMPIMLIPRIAYTVKDSFFSREKPVALRIFQVVASPIVAVLLPFLTLSTLLQIKKEQKNLVFESDLALNKIQKKEKLVKSILAYYENSQTMSKYLPKLFFALGFSIIIGLFVGNYSKVTKYYYLNPDEPKREVSETFFMNNLEGSYESEYLQEVKFFNKEAATVFGLGVFGFFLVIFSTLDFVLLKLKNSPS